MRKVSIIAIAVLLIATLSLSVLAAELGVGVSATGTTVNRGDSVTVTVSVDEKFTCRSGLLSIGFDTGVFTRSDNEWLLSDTTYTEPDGDASFILSDAKAISGNIYQFKLKVASDAAFGEYPLNVTLILRDASGNSYTADKKLTITVACKHEYDSGEVTKEATCTSDGTRVRTCKICNATKNETIEKLGHAYDDGEIVTPAGCIEVGEMLYHCTRCDKTKNEEIPPAGHSYENDCDADCDICGNERTVEHNYDTHWTSDATGHWHQCLDCGDVLEIFRHTPGPEATETTEQICLDCGYVIQTFKPHEHVSTGDWLGDANSHWYQCQCGENFNMEAHVWDAGTPEEATGTITYHCTTCGYAKTVKQEAPQPTESEPGNQTSTEPKDDPKDDDNNESVWMIVSLVLAILLLAAIAFIVVGFITSKKQTGKFSH